jgi:hypothetical protein
MRPYSLIHVRLLLPMVEIPKTPDVNLVNQYGGFSISGDRMAFIDGRYDHILCLLQLPLNTEEPLSPPSYDPWLYACVPPWPSSDDKPFYMIEVSCFLWL